MHLAGQTCEMAAHPRARRSRYGFRIVEDASHADRRALSATSRVGDCRYSDITVFSFHPVKIITTAEGGMAMTNDAELARRWRCSAATVSTRDPDR